MARAKGLIRCGYDVPGTKLSDLKQSLDGLNVNLGPASYLDILLCTYMPLNAPCGLYKVWNAMLHLPGDFDTADRV